MYSQVFSDPKLKQEFLDRFRELTTYRGGFEAIDAIVTVDDAAKAIEDIAEGRWSLRDDGLEAIIQRFTRPVQLVQNNTFTSPMDGFPNSEELGARLEQARQLLDGVLPSVGRIDLQNHRNSWVGTGWLISEGLVATNRHVAEEFAKADGARFVFRTLFRHQTVRASIDWWHEHENSTASIFRIREVLWIEPEPSFDVALLRIDTEGADRERPPKTIPLMTAAEFKNLAPGAWLAVIGYPARDSRNRADDQQRIFDGIYNIKRLAPGQLTAIRPDGHVEHDATTLGGNSGSVVVDLATGKALALHVGGLEGESNYAVSGPALDALRQAHL